MEKREYHIYSILKALLHLLFVNPKNGFDLSDKLYYKAHDIDNNVTHKDVDVF